MKKIVTLLMVVMLSAGALLARDRVTTDASVLPASARTTLKENFKAQINHIKVDSDVFGTEYDVILQNGTEVCFNGDGTLKEVDAGRNTVPDALVLEPIRKYVSANYKGEKITSLEIKKNRYEVELSNGTDLEFDRSGAFLRVDR